MNGEFSLKYNTTNKLYLNQLDRAYNITLNTHPHLPMVEKTLKDTTGPQHWKPTMLSLAGEHRNPPKDDVSCPGGPVKPLTKLVLDGKFCTVETGSH